MEWNMQPDQDSAGQKVVKNQGWVKRVMCFFTSQKNGRHDALFKIGLEYREKDVVGGAPQQTHLTPFESLF